MVIDGEDSEEPQQIQLSRTVCSSARDRAKFISNRYGFKLYFEKLKIVSTNVKDLQMYSQQFLTDLFESWNFNIGLGRDLSDDLELETTVTMSVQDKGNSPMTGEIALV